MLPTWATVAITLGAAAITALSTLGGVILTQRHERRERRRAEGVAEAARVAAAVARLLVILEEAEPYRVISVDADTVWEREQIIRDLAARATPETAVLTEIELIHPTPQVRQLAAEARGAVLSALSKVIGLAAASAALFQTRAGVEPARARANDAREKAMQALTDLAEALRERPG